MEILREYKGYQLVERYGKHYICFHGDDTLCEFPVLESSVSQILTDETLIERLMTKAKKNVEWTPCTFYNIGITEYALYHLHLSPARAAKAYKKLSEYPDILNEFYQYIMTETYPQTPIEVEGYTAEYLVAHFPLSPLGAYNYLIYLREMPQKALADLKAGLPTKDSERYLNP